ncbi:MAG: hypothetical protein A2252_06385 [Elusimicrobia bacterium RIFOXYA2_FULL_39_19]|nr:MAG: hypothetical protein A2252_06385 [Elusimicrobia bacterium RIFOXYA2_FULL_39_19]
MPIFTYKAKNISGQQISGTIEAENVQSVTKQLREKGYFPSSITSDEKKDTLLNKLNLFRNKTVKHKGLVIFTRRLADSLKGGLQLTRALNVISNQTENPELSKISKEIAIAIQEGKSLSEALKTYPAVFSTMYVSMIHAGETAGVLDIVLSRLADFNEREEELRFRINSALAYPVIMLFVGLASVIFLLSFVIPRFEVMFQDLGQSLPLPTKILLFLSHILRYYWWLYIPVIIASIVFIKKWSATEKGKNFISNLTLKTPLTGIFIKKDIISRFIRMLSLLLVNGVPILKALDIAKNSIDNKIFSADIERVYKDVKEGLGLSKSLQKSSLFPPLIAEMISIGEETGNMETSLTRIAESYEREVEYAIKTMTSLLEPVIILFAGLVVCFIALSMLLPVFQVSSGLR